MKKKLQVFVSSTYADLIEERQAVISSILTAGHLPAGSPASPAMDDSQWEITTRWIDECDIFILVLGGRYGPTHPDTGLAFTEMEYDYAVRSGKPYFTALLTDHAIEKKIAAHGAAMVEVADKRKLDGFRSKTLTGVYSACADSRDVKLCTLENLPRLESKYSLHGWFSGSSVAETKQLIAEISRLSEENKLLSKQIAGRKNSGAEGYHQGRFQELCEVLTSSVIDISSAYPAGGPPGNPEKVSGLKLLISFKNKFVGGISDKTGSSEMDQILYHKLGPILQVHGLMDYEKVPGVTWKRTRMTAQGTAFLAEYERRRSRELITR